MKEDEKLMKEKGVSERSDGVILVDPTKYSKKLDKLEHVNFGLVHGMSTREGTVKFLGNILRDAKEKMHEVMRAGQTKYEQVKDPERIADILGISAVLVQDMASKRFVQISFFTNVEVLTNPRINGYTFDMDRMTSFEGDTGPYLQCSCARLCSIIRKTDMPSERLKEADPSLLHEKHATAIVQKLAQWPEVFQATFKNKVPVTVLTSSWKLTHIINPSYDHLCFAE
ncbi:hypothetical protein BDV38DRAFT_287555 [Aspergillus pseudotamarii]|uniref:arginine--tRNA ligase n=1 Tax=Aspergillus pseudotamarii TaxID=132259 RepID=A0A5N6SD38_ASPPS|nr:uncharacterized protein BDV38DRAFT_287555 [Aspergillus pseudotamarii]KAE8132636.1 hypothetical protein BDV38DRAFT_287555 [Aspergillus pseudotamarii]